jgi:hypothetical protein
MLEKQVQDREASEKDVEAVLLELGDPNQLADKYRGSQRYLIGPETFPMYLSILKIVGMAIGIAMLVVFLIQAILTPQQMLTHFVNSLLAFMMASLQGFAWVTISFGVLELTGAQKEKIKKERAREWHPSELPALPDGQNKISRADPIAGIIFIVLFLVLFTFSIDQFGIWIFRNGSPTLIIPFLDGNVFRGFLPFIWAVSALILSKEIIRLITRKWSLPLFALEAVGQILNFVLALFMFSSKAIWNPNYMQQMAQSGLITANSEGFRVVSAVWDGATGWLIYLICVIFAIEIITIAIRAFRMRNNQVALR